MTDQPTIQTRRARIGNWTYDPGYGWRLDGQPVLIDFDRLQRCWHTMDGPRAYEPIDRYRDNTMAWVEKHLSDYLPAEEIKRP